MATTKHKGLGRGLDELIAGGLGGGQAEPAPAAKTGAAPKEKGKAAAKGSSRSAGNGRAATTGAKPAPTASAPQARATTPATAASGATQQPQEPTSLQRVQLIAISSIAKCPWQPRHRFGEEELAELAASIRERGILQPVLLRVMPGGYELIAGERRLRAAQAAGLKEIPALVQEASDREVMELALIENLQRQDLNPMEEAEGYRMLLTQSGLTQEEIAKRLGKARSSVTNSLRLLELPEGARKAVAEGALSFGHAKVLLGAPEALREALAARVVKQGLSVRALEKLVAAIANKAGAAAGDKKKTALGEAPTDPAGERQLKFLEGRMQQELGTKVQLFGAKTLANGRREMGRIVIEFFDAEDLSRLLETLNLADLT